MSVLPYAHPRLCKVFKHLIHVWHRCENGTNLPRHRDLPLCTSNNRNLLILPTLRNTIQNGGSMTRIFVYKSDAACLNHSRFLGLDLEHPKLKSGFTIDNSCASIILTEFSSDHWLECIRSFCILPAPE